MIVRIQFADSLIEIFLFRKRVEKTSTFFYQQISLGILTNQNEGFSISTNAMSSFKFRSKYFTLKVRFHLKKRAKRELFRSKIFTRFLCYVFHLMRHF